MNMNYFKSCIAPQLDSYKLIYSSFPHGDFGSLERVEIEGKEKLATIDFWSTGWLNIDIYDLTLDEQVMNILLKPSEVQAKENTISKLLGTLVNEK